MNMEDKVEIYIDFSDGEYRYQRVDALPNKPEEGHTVWVSRSTVDLWDAIEEMIVVQQRQLCTLDNAMYETLDWAAEEGEEEAKGGNNGQD
jgi:hypothetical protein